MLHGSTRIDRKSARSKKFLTALNRLTLNLYGQHSGAVAIENRQIFRFQQIRNSLKMPCPLHLRQRFIYQQDYYIPINKKVKKNHNLSGKTR